jgi:hypothetical protein
LSADRFSVNFTADGEFRELLDEVRALLSHSEPKGDLLAVMKRGIEAMRSDLLKKAVRRGPEASSSPCSPLRVLRQRGW